MPYSIEWYVENKVLLLRIHGVVTLEDVHGLAHDTIPYYAQVQEEAHHIILDLSEVTRYPTRLAELRNAAFVPTHPNLGWLIFVSRSRLVVFLASTLAQTVHPHLCSRSVRSIEEAIVFLEGQIGVIPRRPVSYHTDLSATETSTK